MLMLAGCQMEAVPQPAASSRAAPMAVWSTRAVAPSQCNPQLGVPGMRSAGSIGPESFSTAIRGATWPQLEAGNGQEFVYRNAAWLNRAATGRADREAMRARLLAAARGDAFTRLDFGAPGGSSPAFISALVVTSTAYAVSDLRRAGAISPEELAELDGWIRRIIRNLRARPPSLDHQAANAKAELFWGAAIGDQRLVATGRSGLDRSLRRMARTGQLTDNLRNQNEMLTHLIPAAAMLRLNGVDLLTQEYGGYTLRDVVAGHARAVRENGERPLRTAGDPADPARSIFLASSWGTQLAWIPVYLSMDPDSAAAEEVRSLDRALRQRTREPYFGGQAAMHAGCLFGRAL
ncbi:MAG: hypothetical protein ACXIUV_11585 [Alkalilacustris sp.]